MSVLAALTVLSYVVEFGASLLGARRFGASRQAVLGAALGTVVGMFFGLPGILIGPFAGAVLGEYGHRRDLGARRAAWASSPGSASPWASPAS